MSKVVRVRVIRRDRRSLPRRSVPNRYVPLGPIGAPWRVKPSLNCSFGLYGAISGAKIAASVMREIKMSERSADLRLRIRFKVLMRLHLLSCKRLGDWFRNS